MFSITTRKNGLGKLCPSTKMLIAIKLSILVLVTCALQVSAKVFAQKITLSVSQAPLEKVLDEIERQSGYRFWYNDGTLPRNTTVDLTIKDATLEEALSKCFSGQPLTWKIVSKTIVLNKKAPPIAEPAPPFRITGVVKDAVTQTPMPGATVVIKGTSRATVTNANGEFELQVDASELALVISFIGYEPKQIRVSSKQGNPVVLSVQLSAISASLGETVVTGYSTKKTGEITGAVQKISGDDLRRGITSSDPVSMLKGRVTGLYISEQSAGDPTSSGGQIFVRGQSSIVGVGVDQYNEFVMPNQNYGPLLVLDGVIMPNQNLKELVNAQDVEDILILKDAAATAIYGSRAAAGVMLVTTKRGVAGKTRLYAEVKYGVNKPNRGSLRFMNAQELYNAQKQYYTEDYQINNTSLSQRYPTLQGYLDFRLPSQSELERPYNWEQYAFLTSSTKEVTVSASGGTEATRFYAGGTYYDEGSTGVENGLKRGTFRLNLDSRLTKRLTTFISLNGLIDKGEREQSTSVGFLYSLMPWANPYNADGSLKRTLDFKLNGFENEDANPLYENQFNFIALKAQRLAGSIRLEYKFTDWLSFSSTNAGKLDYTKNERYIDARSFEGSGYSTSTQGFLGTTTTNMQSFLTTNQLNFRKTFGLHSVRAIVATEFGRTRLEDILVNVNHVRAGYPVISLGTAVGNRYNYSFWNGKAGNIEGGRQDQAVFSAFGEAGYTYNDRYTVSGSLRTDASSSFGRNERYGTFYSFGGAWVVTNEQFAKQLKFLSNLKLRSSYGTSGSLLGDNFLTRTLYESRGTYLGMPLSTVAVLGNPNLKWEVTKSFSVGMDIGLFNRVTASFDYYNRRSEDLLQRATLPALTGFPIQWQNVANVLNRGVEVLVSSENIRRKNFQWSSSFNISFNKNAILSVANDSLRQGFYSANSFYLYPGDNINSLKGVKYAGIDPANGKPLFEKLTFDDKGQVIGKSYVNSADEVGAASDARQFQYIGNFQPKFFGGLSNTFAYKAISLSVLITYAYGYIVNDGLAEWAQGGNITRSNQIAYLKHQIPWTTPGQTNATEPSAYHRVNSEFFGSDKFFHDGSHARLRSVRLGYEVPKQLLEKLSLTRMSIYVSGDNLYTLTSKELISSDPEGPSVGQAQDFGESVGGGIASPRRYMFGLQLTL